MGIIKRKMLISYPLKKHTEVVTQKSYRPNTFAHSKKVKNSFYVPVSYIM